MVVIIEGQTHYPSCVSQLTWTPVVMELIIRYEIMTMVFRHCSMDMIQNFAKIKRLA